MQLSRALRLGIALSAAALHSSKLQQKPENLPITTAKGVCPSLSQIVHETMVSGAIWGEEEVVKLIEAWGEHNIQAQLQDCTRNQRVFEKVAQGLSEAGHSRTYQQCRDKIKKLRAEYKKIKDKHGKTGEGRSKWEYFDSMDNILGNRPATEPPVVTDSSYVDAAKEQELKEEGGDEIENREEEKENKQSIPAASSASNTPRSKRKCAKYEKSDDAIVELTQNVVKSQKVNDENLLELEEKRLQMEERQLEREAEQRREDCKVALATLHTELTRIQDGGYTAVDPTSPGLSTPYRSSTV